MGRRSGGTAGCWAKDLVAGRSSGAHGVGAGVTNDLRITAVASQKGGTGKTALVGSLGPLLAGAGARTLLVDMDQQADLTALYGFNEHNLDHSVVDVLAPVRPVEPALAVQRSVGGVRGLDLLASDLRTAGLEKQLAGEMMREFKLAAALEKLAGDYDEVLIDCPPSLGDLTLNGLCAADRVLSPVAMDDKNAVQGALNLVRTIRQLRSQRQRLELEALVRVRVNHQLRAYRALDPALRRLGLPVAATEILKREDWNSSIVDAVPLVLWAPASEAARNMRELARELWGDLPIPYASDLRRRIAASARREHCVAA